LHLLVDSTGIKVEGEGEWNARKHGGANAGSGARLTSGSTRNPWKSGPPSSPPAMSAMHPCCPSCWTRSQATRRSPASLPTAHSIRASAMMRSPSVGRPRSSAPQERQAMETRHRRGHRPQRHPADIEARRADHLATMERLSPPKPCRDQDALSETARPTPERTGLRPSGRRVPSPSCRAQRLHCARHAHHRGRRIGVSGQRGVFAFR